METIIIEKDIKVFYVIAKSFPDGILEAHQRLHSLVPFSNERKYFGLSRPENGGAIVYRAAAEQLEPGEGEKLNCGSLVLKKGKYVCQTLNNYMNDLQSIERSFKELLTHPDLDPEGYCVEWYVTNKDMKCMIRLEDIRD